MITKLSHTLLSHQEISVTGERIAGLAEEAGLGLSYIDGFAGLVKANVNELNAALAKTRGLELTAEVYAADDRRDMRFKSFRGFIDHKRYSEDANEREHAEYLWAILNRHSLSLWTLGFTDQTARLNTLFSELDSADKAQDALAAIAATNQYAAVKTSQSDFESIFKARTQEASAKDDDPKVRASRKKLAGNLEALLINIEMAEELNQEAGEETLSKIKSLIGNVNEVVASAMSIARARVTRAASEEETEEEPAA